MKSLTSYSCLLLALGLWCARSGPAYAQSAEESEDIIPSPPAADNNAATAGVDVLTRGPIHEAYAEPINAGAVQPIVVPNRPPDPIDEAPPDAKPADENAIWLSGYWSWNDDQKDFIWVSGVWRAPPRGQRWIPGYWTEVSGGYEWVPGFWNPIGEQEIAYYPEPPAALNEAPTSQPPAADYFWVPGCWRWHDSRYVWQAGYWAPMRPGWVWTPASYYWDPKGWVFCDGYWDYPLARRGLMFAPVRFASDVLLQPRFRYTPSVAIDPSALTFYLFVRPTYGHYYFGDYYARTYDTLGIYPWFSVFEQGHYAYDPLYSYYSAYYRGRDPDWANNLRGWNDYYRTHPDWRPPHDLASAEKLLTRAGRRPDRKYLAMAHPLQQWRGKPGAPVRLASVSVDERNRIEQSARQVHLFRTARLQMETQGAPAEAAKGTPTPLKTPQRLPLPEVARSVEPLPSAPAAASRFEGEKPIPPNLGITPRAGSLPANVPGAGVPGRPLGPSGIPKVGPEFPAGAPPRILPPAGAQPGENRVLPPGALTPGGAHPGANRPPSGAPQRPSAAVEPRPKAEIAPPAVPKSAPAAERPRAENPNRGQPAQHESHDKQDKQQPREK